MMDMTNKEYAIYVAGKEEPSPFWRDLIWAFVSGGILCVLAQALNNGYLALGMNEDTAAGAVSVTFIFAAALLTGLGLFHKIAKYAGAGTLIPITGFANSVVAPALEFRSEGLVMGMSAKMFTIAGPVLVFGVSASVIYGILLQLFG